MKLPAHLTRFLFCTLLLISFCTVKAQDTAGHNFEKGTACFFKGDYDSAIYYFNRAISLDTNKAESYNYRGLAYYNKKKYDAALVDYDSALIINPIYSGAYANRGNAYFKMNNARKALVDYDKSIALDSSNSLAFRYRGIIYLQKNKYDSAILDFTRVIQIEPDSSFAYSKRGEAYYQLKKFDLAVSDLTKVISLEPANPDAFEMRSRTYFDKKQADSAMQDINYAIKLKPLSAGNFHTRGYFYNLSGQYDLSVKDFKRCIELDPAYGKAYINIISPLVRLNSFDSATMYYELYRKKRLVSFFDNDKYKLYRNFVTAVTLVSRGKMDLALNNIGTAILQYNIAVKDEIKRAYLDLLFVKAHILNALDRLEEAKVLYKQSLVLDPQQPNIEKTIKAIENKQILTRSFDDKGPQIVLITPESSRGFDIVADSTVMEITGTATDESGIDSVKINGMPAKVESDGYFMATLKLIATVNALDITATDKKGNKSNKIIPIRKKPDEKPDEKMEKMTYHAILIAEKDYNDINIPSLVSPIRDANRLRDVLVNQYTFDPENIDTLYNKSQQDIQELFSKKASTLTDNDNLLVFYAGHGTMKKTKIGNTYGYLIPVNARKDSLYQYIKTDDLKQLLENANARHILIVLDACFSGTILRQDSEFPVTAGLPELNKLASRKVMRSGNAEEVPDTSIFIKYLIKSLEENEDEYLSTNVIWKKIGRVVEDESKNTPGYTPIEGVGDKGGQFIFVRRRKK